MVDKELKLVLETKAIVREDEKFKFAEKLSKYCCPPSADLSVGNANDRVMSREGDKRMQSQWVSVD
jgi:hypothetical protein